MSTSTDVDLEELVSDDNQVICQMVLNGVKCDAVAVWRCSGTCTGCGRRTQLNICDPHYTMIMLITLMGRVRDQACGHCGTTMTVEWRQL